MEYALIVGLTLATSWFIINTIKQKEKVNVSRVLYRQSDMHKLSKNIFFKNKKIETKPESQLSKRIDQSAVSVLITEEKAYWVDQNIFYEADVVDNSPVIETARPIDASQMSKRDIDKMLFILDNLGRGEQSDSGSSGDARF